jgi:hypothetical protein
MFGNGIFNGKKGTDKIIKYMMMSEMMKGNNGTGNGMNSMLPMMMLGGGFEDMFDGIFDFDEDEDIDEEKIDEEEDEE